MSWTEGPGTELPKGILAWVEHPTHGVVWAVKESYTDIPGADDHDSEEQEIFTWCAYGLGEVFNLGEVTRYCVVPPPPERHADP